MVETPYAILCSANLTCAEDFATERFTDDVDTSDCLHFNDCSAKAQTAVPRNAALSLFIHPRYHAVAGLDEFAGGLTSLSLVRCRITNIDALARCVNLRFLWLDDNRIDNIGALVHLKYLELLSISSNGIQDSTLQTSVLAGVRFLSLSRNPIHTLLWTRRWHALEHLDASETQVRDFEPCVLNRRLISLDISGTPLCAYASLENMLVHAFPNLLSLHVESRSGTAALFQGTPTETLLMVFSRLVLQYDVLLTHVNGIHLMDRQIGTSVACLESTMSYSSFDTLRHLLSVDLAVQRNALDTYCGNTLSTLYRAFAILKNDLQDLRLLGLCKQHTKDYTCEEERAQLTALQGRFSKLIDGSVYYMANFTRSASILYNTVQQYMLHMYTSLLLGSLGDSGSKGSQGARLLRQHINSLPANIVKDPDVRSRLAYHVTGSRCTMLCYEYASQAAVYLLQKHVAENAELESNQVIAHASEFFARVLPYTTGLQTSSLESNDCIRIGGVSEVSGDICCAASVIKTQAPLYFLRFDDVFVSDADSLLSLVHNLFGPDYICVSGLVCSIGHALAPNVNALHSASAEDNTVATERLCYALYTEYDLAAQLGPQRTDSCQGYICLHAAEDTLVRGSNGRMYLDPGSSVYAPVASLCFFKPGEMLRCSLTPILAGEPSVVAAEASQNDPSSKCMSLHTEEGPSKLLSALKSTASPSVTENIFKLKWALDTITSTLTKLLRDHFTRIEKALDIPFLSPAGLAPEDSRNGLLKKVTHEPLTNLISHIGENNLEKIISERVAIAGPCASVLLFTPGAECNRSSAKDECGVSGMDHIGDGNTGVYVLDLHNIGMGNTDSNCEFQLLNDFTECRRLSLAGNSLKNLSLQMPRLTHLDASDNDLARLSLNCPHLVYLDLSNNSFEYVSDILRGLGGATRTSLQHIMLFGNPCASTTIDLSWAMVLLGFLPRLSSINGSAISPVMLCNEYHSKLFLAETLFRFSSFYDLNDTITLLGTTRTGADGARNLEQGLSFAHVFGSLSPYDSASSILAIQPPNRAVYSTSTQQGVRIEVPNIVRKISLSLSSMGVFDLPKDLGGYLQRIDLSNNFLVKPSNLISYTRIARLNIAFCAITSKSLEYIVSDLKRLSYLDVTGNRLTTLKALTGCAESLCTLHVSLNRACDMNSLPTLPHLLSLSCYGVRNTSLEVAIVLSARTPKLRAVCLPLDSEIPSVLYTLPIQNMNGQAVDPQDTQRHRAKFMGNINSELLQSRNTLTGTARDGMTLDVRGIGLRSLACASNLSSYMDTISTIFAGGNFINSIVPLKDFANIVQVDLSSNKIADPFVNLRSDTLEALNLADNRLGRLRVTGCSLPSLRCLILRNCDITNLPSSVLSPIARNLTYLDLSENALSNISKESLFGLSRLRTLKCEASMLRGLEFLEVLGNYGNLQSLDVRKNKLQSIDKFCDALLKLQSLTAIFIAGNPFVSREKSVSELRLKLFWTLPGLASIDGVSKTMDEIVSLERMQQTADAHEAERSISVVSFECMQSGAVGLPARRASPKEGSTSVSSRNVEADDVKRDTSVSTSSQVVRGGSVSHGSIPARHTRPVGRSTPAHPSLNGISFAGMRKRTGSP